MIQDYLLPVADIALAHIQLMHQQCLGNTMRIYSEQKGFPDLEGVQIAFVGLRENRRDPNNLGESLNFTEIRRAFYELFP
ncbi:MAG: arginase, partial [Bacteroidota bacterium]